MSELHPAKQPIGVFDSGVGGLTALRKLAELLPNEDLLYLGDTGRVPYGNNSPETIQRYTQECIEFLLSRSAKRILIACNSASAVALSTVEKLASVPIVGVIRPTVQTILRDNYQRIGIIGTRATINSRSYELEIQAQSNGKKIAVFPQACPLLVPLIEEGWHEHSVALAVLKEYLAPLQHAKIDALILGCTHYPFLTATIAKVLPDVALIDSGAEAAILTAQAVGTATSNTNHKRQIECYVTDLTLAFAKMAQQFLGLAPEALHQVRL